MAKFNDKLESHSAKEKFPTQVTLSAPNSEHQHPVDEQKSCANAVTPYPPALQRTPPTETNLATNHAQHLWRFRLALALYTGPFSYSMRQQPRFARDVSFREVLNQCSKKE